MELAMIGLGRMGAAMAQRLMAHGHHVVAFDRDAAAVQKLATAGGRPSTSLENVVAQLKTPRVIWIMLPAGDPVEQTMNAFLPLLQSGDVIIDGGNSNYRDSVRRAEITLKKGVQFVDVGSSGGIWGLKNGYSMMVGGDAGTVSKLRPIFEALAPSADQGWAHVGPVGSGHFAKMVHNGIEYGMMQSYAEGFALLENKKEFNFDSTQVAQVWQHGSVIRSWLLDLTVEALQENKNLEGVSAQVADSGEGRWTVFEGITNGVPCPVITAALLERIRSRTTNSYANRLLSIMRNKFGGHAMK